MELLVGGRRARSTRVLACAEPLFAQSFLLELPVAIGGEGVAALLRCEERLNIIVVRSDENGSDTSLVGTHVLDWRRALQTYATAIYIYI